MARGLSTPDPSRSPTHLSIRRGRATTTHYTHHQVSLMVMVPFPGVAHWASCEASLSAGMRREWGACAGPKERKKVDLYRASSRTRL